MSTRGRTFPIRKNAVRSYGYAATPRSTGRRLRPNPGVSTIAAINGRGAYQSRFGKQRSARASMAHLKNRSARVKLAKQQLTSAQKRAFVSSVKAAKRRATSASSVARGHAKKRAQRLRAYAKRRAGAPYPRIGTQARREHDARSASAFRAAAKKKSRRRRAKPARRGSTQSSTPAHKTRRKPAMKRNKAKATVKRRRKSAKRRTLTARTSTPKRKRRKGVARAAASKRTRRPVAKSAPKRRTRKKKLVANKRRSRRRLRKNSWFGHKRAHSAAAKKGWSKRRSSKARAVKKRTRKGKMKANRRRSTRRVHRKNKRSTSRRMGSNKRRRSSGRRRTSANKRRSPRKSHSKNRRSMRRNGRRSAFRRNGIVGTIGAAFKTGGVLLGGFLGHKLFSNLFRDQVLARFIGQPATATPPAASGLEVLQPYSGLISSALTAAIGIPLANKFVKNDNTKKLVMGGMALSFFHNLAVFVIGKFAPTYAGMLSGAEDGTAARLSAMYGLGAGASIMPRYSPVGEYFSANNGVGEYFAANGMGEYFSQGVQGLGLTAYEAAAGYGANPDMYQAAAGLNATETSSTNHIDPSRNLDRELDIAEAAAGVGALPSYEAAAGMRGLGTIRSLPSADIWVPGTSDGQLWAGVRSVNQGQSATEMVPAGILQTDGGQGVFG